MKLLQQQAKMVNQYGQAAVNEALGDNEAANSNGLTDLESLRKKQGNIYKKVMTPPPSHPVTRHIATMYQIFNDRYNMRLRMR